MKKLFLMLFVTLIVTLSVKAEDYEPITTKRLSLSVYEKTDTTIGFKELYVFETKYKLNRNKFKKNGVSEPPQKTYQVNTKLVFFHLKKEISKEILLKSYINLKTGKKIELLDDKELINSYFTNWYFTIIKQYTDKQIVFDLNTMTIDTKDVLLEPEKHISLFVLFSIIICILYGVIIAIGKGTIDSYIPNKMSDFTKHDFIRFFGMIIIIILIILQIFNEIPWRENLWTLLGVFGFYIAVMIIPEYVKPAQRKRYILQSFSGPLLLILGSYLTLRHWNDLFVPKMLLIVFVSSLSISYLISEWKEIFKRPFFKKWI